MSSRRMPFRRYAIGGALATFWMFAGPASAVETVSVTLDQARVVKIPTDVATVVVGNPLIADVTIQSGGIMVVTGKGYGSTNVIALDRQGKVIIDREINVSGPRNDMVVVYRGVDRESYNCTPTCEQRVTLGDAPKFFDATLNQTVNRIGQATK